MKSVKISFENLSVTGVAVAIPKNKLNMSSLNDEFGNNEVKRIIASTGISSVRVADSNVNASDLCFAATINLLENIKIPAETIDAIVFVSQTPDAIMPATSVMLQHRLGMSTNVVAFDISYGCSGYVYGLYQAAMLIASGGCKRVLLCAGDVITTLLHPSDRQVRMVFGDAGSATLIEKGTDRIAFSLKTDGSGMHHLRAAKSSVNSKSLNPIVQGQSDREGYLYMNGAAIMEFALREVPLMINELLSMKNWQSDEVGTFAFHQANEFMLNYLRKKMALSKQAVPIAVENTGNTGPASIPVVLSLTQDRLREENRLGKVVMCGFGVGLSWASAGLDLSKTLILSPVEYVH